MATLPLITGNLRPDPGQINCIIEVLNNLINTPPSGATHLGALTDAFTDYLDTDNMFIGIVTQSGATGNTNLSIGTADTNFHLGTSGNGPLGILTTGNSNVAIGTDAGSLITSGGNNTLVGVAAGATIDSGTNNTLVGFFAGELTTGEYNTIIGAQAMSAALSGDRNVCIGSFSGGSLTTGGSNICIGYAADVVDGTADNQVVIDAGEGGLHYDPNTGALSVGQYILPATPGTTGQVLSCADNAGTLAWITP